MPETRDQIFLRWVLTAAILLAAASCGQTGDLYLPEQQAESDAPVITLPQQAPTQPSAGAEERDQKEPESNE